MKTYVELECALTPGPLSIGEVEYQEEELHKLHGSHIPVNKYFSKEEEKVTNGYFFWNDEEKLVFLRMWIRSDEVDFFEDQIISGNLIPINVRFTPDDINDESVKNFLDDDIEEMMRGNK